MSGEAAMSGTNYDEHKKKTVFANRVGFKKEMPSTLVCKTCQSNQFHVGHAGYNTLIKCVACGWEEVVHSG